MHLLEVHMNELNLLETATKLPIITWMGSEYALMPKQELDKLEKDWMNKKGERHWYFNFNGDGWNTIWARTQEDAWRKAEQEYGLNLNYSSFKAISSDQYDKIIKSSSQL
jgi:hypothetical protein